MRAYSETWRQVVHIAMASFALLLPFLSWPQAAAMALVALTFNWVLLPRVFPAIMRPADAGGHRAGVLFYPLSVLLLILVFRHRLDIVAAAWGVMAFGDGAATLVGTRVGGPRLPWNPDKTWSGLAAFIFWGALGGVALGAWVAPTVTPVPPPLFTIWASVAAAVTAAFAETIPIKLDDNLSVPFAAGAMFLFSSMFEWDRLALAWSMNGSRWPWALGLNALMAGVAWWRGSLTVTGCIVGAVMGVTIYVAAGPGGWALLFMAFALAVASSALGRARQRARGVLEARERRGAGNALANCLVGTVGAVIWAMWPFDVWGPLMLITGLVAGASDTVASEIGKAYGGVTRSFPSFASVAAGTPGAISATGTVAGLVAAAMMAQAADMMLGTKHLVPFVVAGATCGAFAESALATRFEEPGILNNDVLNFLNTAVASAVSMALVYAFLMMTGEA